VLRRDMEPGFKIKDYLKDLRIIMETAESIEMPLPATALVQQMYRGMQAEGLLEKGTQAVSMMVEKLANEKIV